MRDDAESQNSGVTLSGLSADLAIGGDVIGRDKIIAVGGVTIQQFVKGEPPIEQQLAFFAKHIGLDAVSPKFAVAQFEAYCNAWRSLQAVRLSGDDLWEGATAERLFAFTDALRTARLMIGEGEIFFEPDDLSKLQRLLNYLDLFRRVKGRVLSLRHIERGESQVDYFAQNRAEIQALIEENRRYKADYEELLIRIRNSFRSKLQTTSPR